MKARVAEAAAAAHTSKRTSSLPCSWKRGSEIDLKRMSRSFLRRGAHVAPIRHHSLDGYRDEYSHHSGPGAADAHRAGGVGALATTGVPATFLDLE